MKLETTVSSKGQVTVPIDIRKRLGVKGGDRLRFVVKEGDVVLRPARSDANPFEKFIGALSPGGQPDGTAVAWVRNMRDQNEDD
jgi:AbrB family looped-hinge helix DNA binding protein